MGGVALWQKPSTLKHSQGKDPRDVEGEVHVRWYAVTRGEKEKRWCERWREKETKKEGTWRAIRNKTEARREGKDTKEERRQHGVEVSGGGAREGEEASYERGVERRKGGEEDTFLGKKGKGGVWEICGH